MLATMATTKVVPAMTITFDHRKRLRRGIAAAVVRIIPVEYSDDIVRTPSAPSTNAPNRTPISETATGSKASRSSAGMSFQLRALLLAESAASVTAATIAIAIVSPSRTECSQLRPFGVQRGGAR